MQKFLLLSILFLSFSAPLSAQLIDQLLAEYTFNTGTANDDFGDNHLLVNGATLTEDRFGNPDMAYDFDGINDRIYTENLVIGDYSEVTISAWVKPNTAAFDEIEPIIEGQAGVLYLNRYGNSKFTAVFDNSSLDNTTADASNQSLVADEWVFLVATSDGTTTRLYINSFFENEFPEELVTNDGFFNIGMQNFPRYFNGTIDDVRIYTKALTLEEIRSLYTAPNPTLSSTKKVVNTVDFKVFPNPADTDLTIDIDAEIQEMSIIDAQAKVVKTIQQLDATTIYIGDLPTGIYYLQIETTNGKTGIQKFIKLKNKA